MRERFRLRRSLELFVSSEGDLYLLRGGARAEWVVRGASEGERALLQLLADGPRSAAELAGCGVADPAAALAQLDALELLEPELPPSRHDRQLIYFRDHGDPLEMQAQLRAARVVVIGCGGLGCWALAGLASAGIGTLVLIDDDVVSIDNLNRQILYRAADIGRSKVEAAREALSAFDPDLRLVTHQRRLGSADEIADVVVGADVVVETADWPPHLLSLWIDAACRRLSIPHISAGQDPPKVRVGPFFLPGRPGCLRCQEAAARDGFPLYDELAASRARRPATTATLGPASGVVGSMIAMEVVHLLTGIGVPATAGRAILIDLQTLEMTREAIRPDASCDCSSADSARAQPRDAPAQVLGRGSGRLGAAVLLDDGEAAV